MKGAKSNQFQAQHWFVKTMDLERISFERLIRGEQKNKNNPKTKSLSIGRCQSMVTVVRRCDGCY